MTGYQNKTLEDFRRWRLERQLGSSARPRKDFTPLPSLEGLSLGSSKQESIDADQQIKNLGGKATAAQGKINVTGSFDSVQQKANTVDGVHPTAAITDKCPIRRNANGTLNVEPFGEYVAISQKNRTQSPLLRLPSEIRNQIYDLVFSGKKVYMGTEHQLFEWPAYLHNVSISLLCACRQLYAETVTLPFNGSNEFIYETLGSLGLARGVALQPYQLDGITKILIFCSRIELYRSQPSQWVTGLAKLPALKNISFIVDARFLGSLMGTMSESGILQEIAHTKRLATRVSKEWQRKMCHKITFVVDPCYGSRQNRASVEYYGHSTKNREFTC